MAAGYSKTSNWTGHTNKVLGLMLVPQSSSAVRRTAAMVRAEEFRSATLVTVSVTMLVARNLISAVMYRDRRFLGACKPVASRNEERVTELIHGGTTARLHGLGPRVQLVAVRNKSSGANEGLLSVPSFGVTNLPSNSEATVAPNPAPADGTLFSLMLATPTRTKSSVERRVVWEMAGNPLAEECQQLPGTSTSNYPTGNLGQMSVDALLRCNQSVEGSGYIPYDE